MASSLPVQVHRFCKTKELKTVRDFTELLLNRDLAPDAVALAKMTAKPEVRAGLRNHPVSKMPAEAVIYEVPL